MGKAGVRGPLGSSAFRYEVRPKGDVADLPETLKSYLFDVLGVQKLARTPANRNLGNLKRLLDLVILLLDLTKPFI